MICDTETKGYLIPFGVLQNLRHQKVLPKDAYIKEFPLPQPYLPGNYPDSAGLRYEAEEAYTCLKEGKKYNASRTISNCS